jgi:genome maintenance exonuclease 1
MFVHREPALKYESLPVVEENGVRWYQTPSGVWVPSVTSVIGHATKHKLDNWKKRVGQQEADRVCRVAAHRGTTLHEAVERYLLNEDVSVDNHPGVSFMFASLKPYLRKHINNIIALEKPLYSETLGVAGRVDCIAEWNGVPSIIDFKTSSKEKDRKWIDGYFTQVSSYSCMMFDMFRMRINNLVILMVTNDGTVQVFEEPLRTSQIKQMYEYVTEFKNNHDAYGNRKNE